MRVAVFCGSRSGRASSYQEAAARLGTMLAQSGIGIVYGGGSIGLMGILAQAAAAAGGHVTGVIPHALAAREIANTSGGELEVVGSMHERKARMAELSDAFVALPGGIGTLEEIFEVWTWAQLGQHRKPCCFLNVAGYYDHLFGFFEHMVAEGFLPRPDRDMLIVLDDPADLLPALQGYTPPTVTPWIVKSET